jgi:methyl-accepting chemotaxis protein
MHTVRARLIAGLAALTLAAGLLLAVLIRHADHTLADSLAQAGEADAALLRLELEAEAARALEAAAAGAAQPAVQAATAARDREALRRALQPAYDALRTARPSTEQYQVFVNERPAQGQGSGPFTTALLRLQAPARFGDDVSGWRVIMNRALAQGCGSPGLTGLEMSTSGVAMHGAVAICHEGRNVGTLNVGLRFDRPFLEGVAARRPGSYALYLPAEMQADGRPSFAALLRQGQLAFDPARMALHAVGSLHAAPVATPEELRRAFAGSTLTRLTEEAGRPVLLTVFPVFNVAGERIGVMEAVRDGAALAAAKRQATLVAVAGLAILLLIAGIIVVALDRSVGRPLRRLTAAVGTLSAGTATDPMPEQARRSEVGDLARALEALRGHVTRAREADAREEAQRQAAAEERRHAALHLAATLEDVVTTQRSGFDGAAQGLSAVATRLGEAAGNGEARAQAVGSAAEEARGSTQTIAAAAEQMAAAVAEIARRVRDASTIATRAVEQTRNTGSAVDGLSQSASRIQDVVTLITGIAGQTNLLALNATIEAARAGEAGKGFAVVASEVKSLANQTAKATDDVAAQIAAIRGATEEAVGAIRGIATVVAEVDEIATGIAAAVEQQSVATREIAGGAQHAAGHVDRVAAGLASIRESIAETRQAVADADAASAALRAQGAALTDAVGEVAARLRTG